MTQIIIQNQLDPTRHRVQIARLPEGVPCTRWPLVDIRRHHEPAGPADGLYRRGHRLELDGSAAVPKDGHEWVRTKAGLWVANYWLAPDEVAPEEQLQGERSIPPALLAVAENHGLQDHVHALWCICLTEAGGVTQDLNGGILRSRYESAMRDDAWLGSHDGEPLVDGRPPPAQLPERLYWTSLGTAQVLGDAHDGLGFPGAVGPVDWLHWMAAGPEHEFLCLIKFFDLESKQHALHGLMHRDWHALVQGYGPKNPGRWLEEFHKNWDRIPDTPPVGAGITLTAERTQDGPGPDAPLHRKAIHHAGNTGREVAKHSAIHASLWAVVWAVLQRDDIRSWVLGALAPVLIGLTQFGIDTDRFGLACDEDATPVCSLDVDKLRASPLGADIEAWVSDLIQSRHAADPHGHAHDPDLPDHDHALPDHAHPTPEPAAAPDVRTVTVAAAYRVHECAGLVEDGCAVTLTVRSDTPAELVRETEGWVQVRLEDGTVGWVANEGVSR